MRKIEISNYREIARITRLIAKNADSIAQAIEDDDKDGEEEALKDFMWNAMKLNKLQERM